jgi:hypothetical protein
MKKLVFTLLIISGIIVLNYSCKQKGIKESPTVAEGVTEDSANFILIGKDIITEVIVKPDTLGDSWEVEKVKNYNGTSMYKYLFEKIYSKNIVVYDILSGKPMDISDVKKIENDFGNDVSRIGKLQFTEDWYFNKTTNKITKKIRSTSFAYELKRQDGLPFGYKALFKVKM